jgi:VWFA-related protein
VAFLPRAGSDPWRHRVAPVAALLAFLGPAATSRAQEERFRGEIQVTRIVAEVRVTEHDGSPVLGLGPGDFLVEVDGRAVTVESVEYIPAASQPPPLEDAGGAASAPPPAPPVRREGRLVVLLFQNDLQYARITGLMRMDGRARDLVAGLAPSDRVAIATFRSHLQVHTDFTSDFQAVAGRLTAPEILAWRWAEPDDRTPSLMRHLSVDRARRAANLSEGLEVLGDALAHLPGAKTIVLFGWGVGTFHAHSGVVDLGDAYSSALERLAAARVTVFSLDVTSADRHTLEVGLQALARDTGGFYMRTHLFPDVALSRLLRTLAGRYELTVVPPEELPEQYPLRVRVDIPGTDVLFRHHLFTENEE